MLKYRKTKLILLSILTVGCFPTIAQDYTSETLLVRQITDRAYLHTSFLNTESFGKVPCNGLVVVSQGEAVIFDTPTNHEASAELIGWVEDQLRSSVKAVVPTHFHQDCLAGLDEFHRRQIPSYGYQRTINLARQNGVISPQNSFNESLQLPVGDQKVHVYFAGEGHTKDNVVAYFPAEKVLFGGCLVKAVGAGKGNLEDANPTAWPTTVAQLQKQYPDAEIIVPGHGEPGGVELLSYTYELFPAAQ